MAALLIPLAIVGAYFAVGFAVAVINGLRQRGVRVRWMLAWPAALAAAGGLAEANLGPRQWPIGMGVALLGLVVAALWRPGRSRVRTELLLGAKGWLALGVLWGLGVTGIIVIDQDFNVLRSLATGWWVLTGTATAYAGTRGVDAYAAWSMERERSRTAVIAGAET
jgi:hypothetical protein